MEPPITLCNYLLLLYKVCNSPRDQLSLVNNLARCDGVSCEVAFEQLTHDTILCCKQLTNVLKGKNPKVEDTVHSFVQGYVTWHLCDPRYRMEEVYRQAGQNETAMKFRRFYEKATSIGVVDYRVWASPNSPGSNNMTLPHGKIHGKTHGDVPQSENDQCGEATEKTEVSDLVP
ncbi:hypothetical protein N7468_004884 [Penicillium chermesinum]|uniref:Uncharacterized protein n=1 Tax=Penicillium chermesinum TaxID=63820 RepID=A0A9W9TSZ0_9EURO|nr:uncharacterized protein N7468_004884 [Penicillium chermesinum]KAJ5240265.1 hypothetical protein N7468_004884 [Penicillium chermesinum]KAJ6167133.1 hypothetical protein N7470_002580 [Penicillium chermesinum]